MCHSGNNLDGVSIIQFIKCIKAAVGIASSSGFAATHLTFLPNYLVGD
jgi:hypothetical protein